MSQHANKPIESKWPKRFPVLSSEQQRISDDFMQYWHEVLPRRYGFVDRFNHQYAVKHVLQKFTTTLEIGAGLGEHLCYEKLEPEQEANYYAIDIRAGMVAELRRRYPHVHALAADCQQRLDFQDGFFDRILAIHVLEHLPDLPACVREMHRLCNPSGFLCVVIPCEGSPAYTLARKISAQRIFENRYKQSYRWFIEREHINQPHEILEELSPYFQTVHTQYFPFPFPSVSVNLCIGMMLRPIAL